MGMKRIIVIAFCWFCLEGYAQQIKPLTWEYMEIGGEMRTRALRNFDRLETDIYTPEKVFPEKHQTISADWPGAWRL